MVQRKTGYHHGDLRAQLVEATRQLVEEKGPDHFSVSEACRVAGVSSAAPYRHFKDRDEMIAAVAADGMRRHFDQMKACVEGITPGTLDRINALGRMYVGFATSEPGVFRLMFGAKHDLDTLDKQAGSDVDPLGMVQNEVAQVLGKTEVDMDVIQRSFLLWTFVHGLSFLLIDDKVRKMDLPVDLEAVLLEAGRRVMMEPTVPAEPVPAT